MDDLEWGLSVAKLRDEATACLDAGRLEDAARCIRDAFALVRTPEQERHLVYASLLCVAGDLALAADADAGAALFNRAHEVAHAAGSRDVEAKALWGLAEADVVRGDYARAVERYEATLRLLASSSHPEASAVSAQIEAELRSLRARAANQA